MQNLITDKQLERSYSSHVIPDILKVITNIKNRNVDRTLDLGCEYGGILKLIGQLFGGE